MAAEILIVIGKKGKGFKPPRFLNPGDEMNITIEKIGTLLNRIAID